MWWHWCDWWRAGGCGGIGVTGGGASLAEGLVIWLQIHF